MARGVQQAERHSAGGRPEATGDGREKDDEAFVSLDDRAALLLPGSSIVPAA